MSEIIGKIVVLLGIGRGGRGFEKRRGRAGRVRRENDTVTISPEARRLLASGGDREAGTDGARPE